VAREKNFDDGLNELFDIAHHNAVQLIKIEEDRAFLLDQHSDRKFVMGEVDKELAALQDCREARLQSQIKLQKKEHQQQQKEQQFSSWSNVDETDDSTSEDHDDEFRSTEVFTDCNSTTTSTLSGPKSVPECVLQQQLAQT